MRRFAWVGAFFAAAIAAPAIAEAETFSAAEAARKSASGEIVMVDVRSKGEWARTGVAKGAERVTIHNKAGDGAFLRLLRRVAANNPGKALVFICATGVRSARALALAKAAGLKDAAHVPEGMFGSRSGPGWIARGLPRER